MNLKKKSEINKCEICEIISNEIFALKIAENDFAISFLDKNPLSDAHAIVATKKHYSDLSVAEEISIKAVFSLAKHTSNKIALNVKGVTNFCFLFNEKTIAGQKYNHFYLNIIPEYDQKIINIKRNSRWIEDLNITHEKIMKK